MSKICRNCGMELPDDAAFCAGCGINMADVGQQSARQQSYQDSFNQNPYGQPYPASYGQNPYGQLSGNPEKKKTKILYIIGGIVIVLLILLKVGGFVVDYMDAVETAKKEAEIPQRLQSGLPITIMNIPMGSFVTEWGGFQAAVPFTYNFKRTNKEYQICHPDAPKRIDQMVLSYDDSFRAGGESEQVERYKTAFDKIEGIGYIEYEEYTLYLIEGKIKMENKNCSGSIILIFKENEMYTATVITDGKDSQLGLRGEYLGFNPYTVFEEE